MSFSKKIFASALMLTILALPAISFAQSSSGGSQPSTDPTSGGLQSQNADPMDYPSVWIPTGIPGQVGVPSTNPVNDTPLGTAAGSTTAVSGAPKNTLTQCDAIKFKSVLDILIWLKCVAVALLIPLIFAAAFVVFLWGVLKFMSASSADKKKESQKMIWWGLVGLFVMVSVWGIIKIASNTLGIDPVAVPLLQTDYLNTNNASH